MVLFIPGLTNAVAWDFLSEILDERVQTFLSLSLVLTGIGVYLIITVAMPHGAQKKLLQEGDFTVTNKFFKSEMAGNAGINWRSIVAIYLSYSFLTMNWERSWIIWPVVAILFAILLIALELVFKKDDADSTPKIQE